MNSQLIFLGQPRLTLAHQVRGQGLQHAITDANNYVDALLKIAGSHDPASRQEVMSAYDAEMVPRGALAVKQSVQEAENAFDADPVSKLLMVKHGHGKLDSLGATT